VFKQHYTANSDGISFTFLSSFDVVLNNVISGYLVASSSVECEYQRNSCLKLGTLFLVNESHDRQTDRGTYSSSCAGDWTAIYRGGGGGGVEEF